MWCCQYPRGWRVWLCRQGPTQKRAPGDALAVEQLGLRALTAQGEFLVGELRPRTLHGTAREKAGPALAEVRHPSWPEE